MKVGSLYECGAGFYQHLIDCHCLWLTGHVHHCLGDIVGRQDVDVCSDYVLLHSRLVCAQTHQLGLHVARLYTGDLDMILKHFVTQRLRETFHEELRATVHSESRKSLQAVEAMVVWG